MRLRLKAEQIGGNHKWRDVTAEEKIVTGLALPAALLAVPCTVFFLFFSGRMQIFILGIHFIINKPFLNACARGRHWANLVRTGMLSLL